MLFNQTTERLDDAINNEGCAFLSGLLLAEQAGHEEWTDPSEANANFKYLVDAGVLRADGFINSWPSFGMWLFNKREFRYHFEPATYKCGPDDFAEALYARTDVKGTVHMHFIAAYPKEQDPYPNSLTRRIGRIVSYRVFTMLEA